MDWIFSNFKSKQVSKTADRSDNDFESTEDLLPRGIEYERQVSKRGSAPTFVLLHIVIAAIWLYILSHLNYSAFPPEAPKLRPLEFQSAEEAIEYETVIFERSGLGTRKYPVTMYEGPPTPERDLAWYHLMDVGFLAISNEQAESLPYPTTTISKTDSRPLINLDVFHQLHCLYAVRQMIYGVVKYPEEGDIEGEVHIDHCLDYLRQVIMCHSDVTVVTNSPRPSPYAEPGLPDWKPNFAVPHTCRNFQKIHDWAAQFNTSGFNLINYPHGGT